MIWVLTDAGTRSWTLVSSREWLEDNIAWLEQFGDRAVQTGVKRLTSHVRSG